MSMTNVNDTGGKLPPVSTTQAANLPPVSTISAANLPLVSATLVANCHWYQRHRRQIMGTISSCRHLKVNLKAKIYLYVNSTTQRCPNKIIKSFPLEDFFHLSPISLLLTCTLSRDYLREFSKKMNGILRCCKHR